MTTERLERLIRVLEDRAKEMDGKAKAIPFKDKYGRGHYSGWAAATHADVGLLRSLLEEEQWDAEEAAMDAALDSLGRDDEGDAA